MKYAFTFIVIFTFFGCSRQFQIARVVPGKTDIDQVVKYLKEPDVYQNSSFNAREEVLIWQDVTVQVMDEIVSAVHRQPASHEKSLQFWKQHYKASMQKFNKVKNKNSTSSHLWQLDLPEHGINVVYDEKVDEVIKVVYYYVE